MVEEGWKRSTQCFFVSMQYNNGGIAALGQRALWRRVAAGFGTLSRRGRMCPTKLTGSGAPPVGSVLDQYSPEVLTSIYALTEEIWPINFIHPRPPPPTTPAQLSRRSMRTTPRPPTAATDTKGGVDVAPLLAKGFGMPAPQVDPVQWACGRD